jgi:glycosyltransferase involved in cell wall biosynthesis
MPTISVILPVYNGARHLEQALGSIREQRIGLDALEVIATDDGSTDASPAILAAAAASLPLTVIPGARQNNWVASTNLALARATGDFICFLHQDDRFLPDKLRALLDAAQRQPGVGVFAHPARFIDGAGRAIGTWSPPAPARRLCPAEWFPPLLVQNNLAVPGVMFRRTLLDAVGNLDESLRYTADWDFWLRLAARHDLVLLPEPLAEYRIHREAQTVGFAEKQTEYADNLRIVLDRHVATLDALPGIGCREADGFRAMAALGVTTNLWLASRFTTKPQPVTTLLHAVRTAGIRNSLRYLRLSRIIPRALARLRANIVPDRNKEPDP